MAYPKIQACPQCNAPGEDLSVYTYDHGGKHVECDECYYLGPCGSNIRDTIRLHNAGREAFAAGIAASHARHAAVTES